MADKLGAANVEIGANIAPLKKGLQSALGAAKGFGAAFTTALGPIAAIIAGGLAIKESIASFVEGEAGVLGLANALKATGQNVNDVMPKFETFAGQIQQLTTFDDDATRAMLTYATNLGLVGKDAQEATKASIGLAKAFGIDTATAMKALTLEMSGNKSALDRQIPALKNVTDETQRLAIIQEASQRGWEQEMAATETVGGSWAQLQNALGDMSEAFGAIIAGDGQGFLGLLQSMVEWTTNTLGAIATWKHGLLEAFSASAAQSGTWANTITKGFDRLKSGLVFTSKVVGFTVGNIGLSWDVLTEQIANVIIRMMARFQWFAENVGIVATYIYDNWKEILTDLGTGTIAIFTNLVENIKRLFTGLWDYVASGGQKGFEKGFVGMLDGFKSSIKNDLDLKEFVPPDLLHEATDKWGKALQQALNVDADTQEQIATGAAAAMEENFGKGVQLNKVELNAGEAAANASKGKNKASFKSVEDVAKELTVAAFKQDTSKQQLKVQKDQLAEQKATNKKLDNLAVGAHAG